MLGMLRGIQPDQGWDDFGAEVIGGAELGTVGDGAGAVLLKRSATPGILSSHLHADGSHSGILSVPGSVCGGQVQGRPYVEMEGNAVVKFAGGISDTAGELDKFNAVEIQQADVRVANSPDALIAVLAEMTPRYAVVDLKLKVQRVGDLQAELVQDFFEGFASAARANVHLKVLYGRSSHHQVEAIFKAFARALRFACAKDRRLARQLPSTKGLL